MNAFLGQQKTIDPPLTLESFNPAHAPLIAGWVRTANELWQLAPSTPPPLTPEKILKWPKPGGQAFIGRTADRPAPIAYGELNPMRVERDQYWLGHVIVDPQVRGVGLGRRFVELLVAEAFEERAARRILLVVFPDNPAAIRCYERVGFLRAGEERHRFSTGGPLFSLLRLELSIPPRRPPQSAKSANETAFLAR